MNNNIKHRSSPGAASTAEATTRSSTSSPGPLNDYPSVYSSPNTGYLDSNAVHRMVLSSSPYQHRASHLSLYHSQPNSESYIERVSPEYNPHFFQIHSHLNSGLLHKTSGPTALFNGQSAFRRISPHDHSFSFHHLQRHRNLLERERGFESIFHKSVSLDIERERMNKERVSPPRSDRDITEYQNVENSACGSPRSTHSGEGMENGPRFEAVKVKKEQAEGIECCDRQCEETHSERPKRKTSAGQTPCCPICGLTIRPGEMDSHYAWEMDRLCEDTRKGRKSHREAAVQARKSLNKRVKQEGVPNDDTPASTRHQTYLRVCANRMSRTGRSSKSTRSRSAQSSPVNPAVYDNADEGTSGIRSATCPVCTSVIQGTGEELNAHVEACLRKRGETSEEMNGQASFEEYEWAGQTRIRATSLLEGGFRASGFQTGVKRKSADEDDGDLNIDGDDTEEFGRPQYTEGDIIPCSADEPGEDRARQALRGAVLSCENSPASRNTNTPPRTRWSDEEREITQSNDAIAAKEEKPTPDSSNPELVINSLKTKVKDLEKQTVTEKVKCLICMEPYTVPLVSISCWHVHCEECWLRTLGAKKLCPQCNMITSPNDLRRIYL